MASTAAKALSSRIDRRRLLLAILLLPLFDALLGYTTLPWLMSADRWGTNSSNESAMVFAGLAGMLGFFVTITAAAPIALWLERRGQMSAGHFTLAGAAIGNAPAAVYLAVMLGFAVMHLVAGTLGAHLSSARDLLEGAVQILLTGSCLGAASGAFFWLIAIRRSHLDGAASTIDGVSH
jgi:hypothetical protein